MRFWILESWWTTVMDSEDLRKLNLKPPMEKAETTWLLSWKCQRAQEGAVPGSPRNAVKVRRRTEDCLKVVWRDFRYPNFPPTFCATKRLPFFILAEWRFMIWKSKTLPLEWRISERAENGKYRTQNKGIANLCTMKAGVLLPSSPTQPSGYWWQSCYLPGRNLNQLFWGIWTGQAKTLKK